MPDEEEPTTGKKELNNVTCEARLLKSLILRQLEYWNRNISERFILLYAILSGEVSLLPDIICFSLDSITFRIFRHNKQFE